GPEATRVGAAARDTHAENRRTRSEIHRAAPTHSRDAAEGRKTRGGRETGSGGKAGYGRTWGTARPGACAAVDLAASRRAHPDSRGEDPCAEGRGDRAGKTPRRCGEDRRG